MPLAIRANAKSFTEISFGASTDLFGAGLAASDNYLVVGAPQNDTGGTNWGRVYFYELVLGTWTLVNNFGPVGHTGTTTACNFGAVCDLVGDVAAVGAIFDNQYASSEGAVYVYRRIAGTWTYEAKLRRPGTSDGTRFGLSLRISSDGNAIIAGCPTGTTGDSVGGAVWLFTWNGVSWSAGTLIQRADPAASDIFGYSVDMSSDMTTVIVSAPFDDDSFTNSGSVYVFEGTPSTGYVQTHKLVSSSPIENDRLGVKLAIYGDVIAASSHLGSSSSAPGGLNIFRKTMGSWSHVGSFTTGAMYSSLNVGAIAANNAAIAVGFLAGQTNLIMKDSDTVIVPSPLDRSYNNSSFGSVWVFEADGTWEDGAKSYALWPSDLTTTNPRWGTSVAVNSSSIFVSRIGQNSDATTVGSVYEIFPEELVVSDSRYLMRGWRPGTADYETWIAVGAPNSSNPSGQPISDITIQASWN